MATIAHIGSDAAYDAYERMPIEDFGKSVLSKLGWNEGRAIGRSNMLQGKSSSKIADPIEYKPRQHRLGLGAKPLSLE